MVVTRALASGTSANVDVVVLESRTVVEVVVEVVGMARSSGGISLSASWVVSDMPKTKTNNTTNADPNRNMDPSTLPRRAAKGGIRAKLRSSPVFGPLNGVRSALVVAAVIAAFVAFVTGFSGAALVLLAGVAIHGAGWAYLYQQKTAGPQRPGGTTPAP